MHFVGNHREEGSEHPARGEQHRVESVVGGPLVGRVGLGGRGPESTAAAADVPVVQRIHEGLRGRCRPRKVVGVHGRGDRYRDPWWGEHLRI